MSERKRLEEVLNRKDYLITVYECGDKLFSRGDTKKEIMPRRYWEDVSLNELKEKLNKIHKGFWTHPDLNEDYSNAKDIPFEEKKFGIIHNIIVEPFSEELEKDYVKASKDGFFKRQRLISEEHRMERE